MAFCKFCGREIPEGTACNCPEAMQAAAPQQGQSVSLSKGPEQPQQNMYAGQPQQQAAQPGAGGFAQPQPQPNGGMAAASGSDKKLKAQKNLIIIGGGLVLLILLLILIKLIAGGGYKSAVKDYIKSINKCDGELYCETLYTEDYIEELADDMDYDVDEYYDYRSEMLEDLYDEMEDEYGKNVKIKVKFEDARELRSVKLNDYEDNYDRYYDSNVEITKGYKVECELTIRGRDDDDSENVDFYVFKIKGEGWKVYPSSGFSF